MATTTVNSRQHVLLQPSEDGALPEDSFSCKRLAQSAKLVSSGCLRGLCHRSLWFRKPLATCSGSATQLFAAQPGS